MVSKDEEVELLKGVKEFIYDPYNRRHFVVNLASIVFRERLGYPQVNFCLDNKPEICYEMMKNETEAKLLAREIIEEDCIKGYDQDCPQNSLELELYSREKAENEWCRAVSGEDFGCEETDSGYVYWQEL